MPSSSVILGVAVAPPLAGHHLLVLLLQIGVLLVGAVLAGRLAVRIGLPPVVGELFTGLLLGPSLLGWAAPDLAGWLMPAEPEQAHLLDAVSQLGALLLVGVTGMHLDLGALRTRARVAIPVSLGGIALPVGLGVAVGFLLPAAMIGENASRGVFALFLGVAMGVSAIPVIAKTLTDLKLLDRDVGQLILTAATVDDAVSWLLLSIVTASATVGITVLGISQAVAITLLLVPACAIAARPLIRWALRAADRSAEPGVTGAVAVVVVLLSAAGTNALGLEALLGAFVAGTLIGSSGVRPQSLAPLRTFVLSVLAPLFLATVGLRIDLTALTTPSLLLAAVLVTGIAILGKFLGVYSARPGQRLRPLVRAGAGRRAERPGRGGGGGGDGGPAGGRPHRRQLHDHPADRHRDLDDGRSDAPLDDVPGAGGHHGRAIHRLISGTPGPGARTARRRGRRPPSARRGRPPRRPGRPRTTTIRSAIRTVENRCETSTRDARRLAAPTRPACSAYRSNSACSVSASSAAVGSSRTSSSGAVAHQRAAQRQLLPLAAGQLGAVGVAPCRAGCPGPARSRVDARRAPGPARAPPVPPASSSTAARSPTPTASPGEQLEPDEVLEAGGRSGARHCVDRDPAQVDAVEQDLAARPARRSRTAA